MSSTDPDRPAPAATPAEPARAGSVRSARALRITLVATAAACIVLGLIGLGVALLAGSDDEVMWPGLSLLALAQAVALVATGAAGWGLRRLLRGDEARHVTDRVRAVLRVLEIVLLVLLVVGAVVWIVARPATTVAVVSSAVVGAQVALVLHILR